VNSEGKFINDEYRTIIRDACIKGKFRIAANKKAWKDGCDDVMHNKRLYLRGKKLMKVINKRLPSANRDNVIETLIIQEVIIPGNVKRAKQLNGECKGKRFYVFSLSKLMQ
jgi:hypothetical protein